MTHPSVVYITGQLGLGGAERQLFLLVRELVRAGHRIGVITLNPGTGDYWEAPIVAAGASLHTVSTRLPRPAKALRIASILRTFRPHVVHSWTLHTNVYASVASRLAGVRVRLGSERSNHQSSRGRLGALYGLTLWGLDAIVTNNRPAAESLRAYRPKLAVATVANGVEVPDLLPLARDRRDIREQWGLPESAVVLGAVGSLIPEKGFETLFDAVVPLWVRFPGLFVAVVGDGPGREMLMAAAAKSPAPDRFRFPGGGPVATVYGAFDLFCLPTRRRSREGMPNVVMEASAAGLAVVATDVGGTGDLVVDGQTGFLVPPEDPHRMRASLAELVESPELRARLGAAGRRHMAERFTVSRMVEHMTAVYTGLLREKHAGGRQPMNVETGR